MAIDQDTIAGDLRNLKELISKQTNVLTIDESKRFMQKLEQVCGDNHDYLESEIVGNICQYKVYLALMSDEKTRNTFSELTSSFVKTINEYLKGKREEYGDE